MGSVTAKLGLFVPILLGIMGLSFTDSRPVYGQFALVSTAVHSRDMTTNNNYCGPNTTSVFVDRETTFSTHAAMLFDISELPAGATVTSAALQLYPSNTMSHEARIFSLATFDTAALYNCMPASPLGSHVVWNLPETSGVYIQSPDVVSLLEAAVDGSIAFVITPGDAETQPTGKGFRTLEFGAEFAPKLVIEYTVPPPATATPVFEIVPWVTPTPIPIELPGRRVLISQTTGGIPPMPPPIEVTLGELPEVDFAWGLDETAWIIGLMRYIPSWLAQHTIWNLAMYGLLVIVSLRAVISLSSRRSPEDTAANLPPAIPNKRSS